MKGKSELLFFVVALISVAFNWTNHYWLAGLAWLGVALVQLSYFCLKNSWRRLSLALITLAIVGVSIGSLLLTNWSTMAIVLCALIIPVVVIAYRHQYRQ
ncbi:hypothetical protein ACVRZR_10310 [Streptococcus entericus]|uniref:hypothetical protein n=1 Tax=Streptococcus entericus TaxID=155680 RepID=UPI00037D5AAD|nr:hypothetical protein [Streptococcus entericus]